MTHPALLLELPPPLPRPVRVLGAVALLLAAAALLWFSASYHYLLFHSLVELTSVIISVSIFLIYWSVRHRVQNNFLAVYAMGNLGFGIIDLFHALTYTGMAIFPPDHFYANQLWVCARFLEALTLCAAFLSLRMARRPDARWLLLFVGAYTAAALLSVLSFEVFPVCYRPGFGQTGFKVAMEYFITAMMAFALILLVRHRSYFSPALFRWLLLSTIAALSSELFFSLYFDNYGLVNFAGHCLKLLSVYFIFRAMVLELLHDPLDLLFREMRQDLDKRRADLEQARELQVRLNRVTQPARSAVELATHFQPCEELGGDFYRVVEREGRLAVVLGDCVGHGLQAAMEATLLSSVVDRHLGALLEGRAAAFLSRVNRDLCTYLEADRACTLLAISLDTASGELRYANANAPLPMLVHGPSATSLPQVTGMHLAFDSETEYAEGSSRLDPGGLLCLYSDGLIEQDLALGRGKSLLALERDLVSSEALSSVGATHLEGRLGLVLAAVDKRFGPGPLRDDLSLILVKLAS
jgi:serine phosphatase RsbU (regulator of sigma subunit)